MNKQHTLTQHTKNTTLNNAQHTNKHDKQTHGFINQTKPKQRNIDNTKQHKLKSTQKQSNATA